MRKHWLLFILLTINISVSTPPVSSQTLTIVKDRQPLADIVVAADASQTIRVAAETLQRYIAKSTGAVLPIRNTRDTAISIVLQNVSAISSFPKLDQDGFILQGLDKRTFIIAGSSDQGIEFGVYEFLERYLNVRWLMPGALGEDVPSHVTLDIPVKKIQQQPVFLSRLLGGIRASTVDSEWARRNRAVSREEHGHNLLNIFPPEQFAKSHPEFYPLYNGKRYIPQPGDLRWQPNFSAPGIVDAAVSRIEKYFRENPEKPSYSLAMNDSRNFDQSPASLARRNGRKNYMGLEDVSDDYFLWANQVAQKVLLTHPDKWFGTLAYNNIATPPRPEIGVNSRIIPFLTQERLRWIDPGLREQDQQRTLAWAKEAENLGWYDYTYGMFYFAPRVWPHLMQQYLSWGAEHHVTFYAAELYPNWGEGPKAWVLAKLLWNPHQNVDDLLNDWYRHAAGNAATPYLKEYYALWEKYWTQDILHSKWWTGEGSYLPFINPDYLADIPPSYIERSDALLQKALESADTPERKARVGKLQDVWQRLYKPSILIYQAAHRKKPQTAEEAISLIDEAIQEADAAGKRQQFFRLLPSDKEDPFYHFMATHLSSLTNNRRDRYWLENNPLFWSLLPWIQDSATVKKHVEQIAPHSSSARLLLAASAGKGKTLLKNASFENGLADWNLTSKTVKFPARYQFKESTSDTKVFFSISTDEHNDGKQHLVVSAVREGRNVANPAIVSQDLPYKQGDYYLQSNIFIPQNGSTARIEWQVEALDSRGKPVVNSPFISSGRREDITPGEWTTFRSLLHLPSASQGEATLRISLIIRMLTQGGDFNPHQKVYVDTVDLYEIPRSTLP